MNALPSPLLLLGIGGAGAVMTRGVLRAYGPGIRAMILDTDASSGGNGDLPFTLLGGNRLAGRGTGGQPASARAAFQDDPTLLDTALEGVRTVVIVTALGGGTGGGATGELLKHLHTLGITTLLFATLPFSFEGPERMRTAKTAAGPLEQHADVTVLLPLDDLVRLTQSDNMKEALTRGADTLASGVTLLWRLLERPGYIALDAERLRATLAHRGRAHFATLSATGPDRVNTILAQLAENPLLVHGDTLPHIRSILLGILAGDDLRLSEVAALSAGLAAVYGQKTDLQLGTVNDEDTFSGRLAVVLLLFAESATAISTPATDKTSPNRPDPHVLVGLNARFKNSERSSWNGEDLDIPTYIRRQLTLDR